MRTAFLTVAIVLLFAGPARADIFAVAPVVAPGHSDIDDPSISTDGQQLAFERVDLAGGRGSCPRSSTRATPAASASTRSPCCASPACRGSAR